MGVNEDGRGRGEGLEFFDEEKGLGVGLIDVEDGGIDSASGEEGFCVGDGGEKDDGKLGGVENLCQGVGEGELFADDQESGHLSGGIG